MSVDRSWTLGYEDEIAELLRTYEQDVRERISQAIEMQCEADEPPCLGCFTAARIARGEHP